MFDIIVLATTNKNKVIEFNQFLKDFPVEIKCLDDFGPLPAVVEDGATFDDNAYKKAHHYAKVLGLPTIADDSGLMVEALGGAPGVFSARYAGEQASDGDNCRKLLEALHGTNNRRASFVCVLSIAVPSGPTLTYEASCDGVILDEPRGDGGFGYDPLFFFEPLGKTFAELSVEEKNKVSHRGKVLAELSSQFQSVLQWVNARLKEELPPHPDHEEFMDNDWSR